MKTNQQKSWNRLEKYYFLVFEKKQSHTLVDGILFGLTVTDSWWTWKIRFCFGLWWNCAHILALCHASLISWNKFYLACRFVLLLVCCHLEGCHQESSGHLLLLCLMSQPLSPVTWFKVDVVDYSSSSFFFAFNTSELKTSYVQPKWLTEPKLCHCLSQGRTLNDILMRAAYCMATLTLPNYIKLKLMYWKRSDPNCSGQSMMKRHWWPPASKMSNSRLLRRTGCQYVGYFYYSDNLNWAARNLRLGRMRPEGCGLDIAGLNHSIRFHSEVTAKQKDEQQTRTVLNRGSALLLENANKRMTSVGRSTYLNMENNLGLFFLIWFPFYFINAIILISLIYHWKKQTPLFMDRQTWYGAWFPNTAPGSDLSATTALASKLYFTRTEEFHLLKYREPLWTVWPVPAKRNNKFPKKKVKWFLQIWSVGLCIFITKKVKTS